MIDLHSHTTASDGTLEPYEVVALAHTIGLKALAITDHDTLAGADAALGAAAEVGLELIVGIELSTRAESICIASIDEMRGRRMPSVHLLAYFFDGQPSSEFRSWILTQQESRRNRNLALIEKLRSFGLDITLDEVQVLGRNLTGRPHFAQILLRKGYVSTVQEAFDRYLADDASAAVERDEPGLVEAVQLVVAGGGTPVLAHPVRLPFGSDRKSLAKFIGPLHEAGMSGIEVFHSDHLADHVTLYRQLANEFGLEETGGSDFHGQTKPSVSLGTGKDDNLAIPDAMIESLKLKFGPESVQPSSQQASVVR